MRSTQFLFKLNILFKKKYINLLGPKTLRFIRAEKKGRKRGRYFNYDLHNTNFVCGWLLSCGRLLSSPRVPFRIKYIIKKKIYQPLGPQNTPFLQFRIIKCEIYSLQHDVTVVDSFLIILLRVIIITQLCIMLVALTSFILCFLVAEMSAVDVDKKSTNLRATNGNKELQKVCCTNS